MDTQLTRYVEGVLLEQSVLRPKWDAQSFEICDPSRYWPLPTMLGLLRLLFQELKLQDGDIIVIPNGTDHHLSQAVSYYTSRYLGLQVRVVTVNWNCGAGRFFPEDEPEHFTKEQRVVIITSVHRMQSQLGSLSALIETTMGHVAAIGCLINTLPPRDYKHLDTYPIYHVLCI